MLHHSLVIGIAGGSASGKSTFADALSQAFSGANPPAQVEVFHTDAYAHRDKRHGPVFVSASTGGEQFDWNHPDAIENARLLAEMEARAAAPDAPDVIVVEGLMVLHEPAVRQRLDLRLFIELDADERALRRLLRNVGRGQEPSFIASYYRESARVGHARFVEPSRIHADFIIRGDADFGRLASLAVGMAASLNEYTKEPYASDEPNSAAPRHRHRR